MPLHFSIPMIIKSSRLGINSSAPSPLLTDLAVYLKADESSGTTLSDSSGNGNDATLIGSRAISSGGLFNNCTDGDGVVEIAYNAGLTANELTIMCWLKKSVVDANQHPVATFSGVGFLAGGFRIDELSGNITIEFYGGSGTTTLSTASTTDFSDGNWHQIIFTYSLSNTRARIYIDGSLNGYDNAFGTMATPDLRLTWGTFDNGGFSYFIYWPGKIDEMAYWTREITSTEVTSLYNSGAGIQYPF